MTKKRGKKVKHLKLKARLKLKKKHISPGNASERNLENKFLDVNHLFEKKHDKKDAKEHFYVSSPDKKINLADRRLALPFGILYLFSFVLYIFSFLKESWVAVVIAVIIMFSSLFLFRSGKKVLVLMHKYLSILYLSVWVLGTILLILSIFRGNTFSATLAILVMFFCSLVSTISPLSHKAKKIPSLRSEINGLANKGKYITDLDKILMLLNKYKRLKVTQIIEGFGMSKETIEGWIDTLEQHGLLKVKFPIFSGMEIILPGEEAKKKDIKKEKGKEDISKDETRKANKKAE